MIADYIRHNRNLGKRFVAEEWILSAFIRSIDNVPLRHIRPEMIANFVDRKGTSTETIAKKHRVLAGFFRYATTRGRLKISPMPPFQSKRGVKDFTPYIFSKVELKRLLAAVPAATDPRSAIDADTLRTFVLLLYGAGLRRGEACRLTIEDVNAPQALLHIRETKFFKTRIVPIADSLSEMLQAYMAKHCGRPARDGASPLFRKRDGTPLTKSAIAAAFRRLRILAGIKREGGARNQPRLHDLRHSAAVHRVTSWYRTGADLNRIFPLQSDRL